jgi:hypothetical protein
MPGSLKLSNVTLSKEKMVQRLAIKFLTFNNYIQQSQDSDSNLFAYLIPIL